MGRSRGRGGSGRIRRGRRSKRDRTRRGRGRKARTPAACKAIRRKRRPVAHVHSRVVDGTFHQPAENGRNHGVFPSAGQGCHVRRRVRKDGVGRCLFRVAVCGQRKDVQAVQSDPRRNFRILRWKRPVLPRGAGEPSSARSRCPCRKQGIRVGIRHRFRSSKQILGEFGRSVSAWAIQGSAGKNGRTVLAAASQFEGTQCACR
mmetsp:Transcript_1086/g.6999  ORF Transcript_1086/g.6999 Transcript_1086/m.6999 type:complete len:203 (-) Transcript_1086:1296-1904(-)